MFSTSLKDQDLTKYYEVFGGEMERNTVATPIEDLKEHDLITNGHELGLLRGKSIEPPSGGVRSFV